MSYEDFLKDAKVKKSRTCDVCGDTLPHGMKGKHFHLKHPEYDFNIVREKGNHERLVCRQCRKRVSDYGDLAKNHLHKDNAWALAGARKAGLPELDAMLALPPDFLKQTIETMFFKKAVDVHPEAYLVGYAAGFKEGVKFGYDLVPDGPPAGCTVTGPV